MRYALDALVRTHNLFKAMKMQGTGHILLVQQLLCMLINGNELTEDWARCHIKQLVERAIEHAIENCIDDDG